MTAEPTTLGFACQHCGGDAYYCAKRRRGLFEYTSTPAPLPEWERKLVGELPTAMAPRSNNGWRSILRLLAKVRDEESRYLDRGLPLEIRGLKYIVAIDGKSYEMEA